MSRIPYPILSDAFASESPRVGAEAPALNQLFELSRREVPWDYAIKDVRDLQIEAFNECLKTRRAQIPFLDQRASQFGVEAVDSLETAVPLLFASSTYKSYPASFVGSGRWSQLLRWLDSLSTVRLAGCDVDACDDIDAFITELTAHGYHVITSSGTSGKVSLLPESPLDFDRNAEIIARNSAWMFGLDPAQPRAMFNTGHSSGPYRGIVIRESMFRAFGRSGATFTLFEEPLLAAEVSKVSSLNHDMVKGTATPSELVELRDFQQRTHGRSVAAVGRLADKILEHLDEPIHVGFSTYVLYLIMEEIKKRGIEVPRFHPQSGFTMAGGLKNNVVADTWEEDLRKFYGATSLRSVYGMSEHLASFPSCVKGRWHAPPTTMLFVLDESGERVLTTTSGAVQGLLGLFDFALDGRWGGITTSDWVEVDFDPCPCGLDSPTVLSCQRFEGVRADDKLNCGGRIEMYTRGVVS